MNTQETIKKTSNYIRNSATFKIFSIGILVLVLLIPTSMIRSLINEREHRKNSVVDEISSKWGNSQTITGPFITIPYKNFYKDYKDKTKYDLHYLHILPEELSISGKIRPEIRYRSLYEAVMYNVNLDIHGKLKIPELSQLNIEDKNILWDKAFFSIGISDLRGIQERIEIKFNGSVYNCNPGLTTTDLASSGVGTLVRSLRPEGSNTFSFKININGSEQLNFIPVGESSNVTLRSPWPSPSFNGAFLPTSRAVNNHGFTASWKVLHLNRNYPQYWVDNQYKIEPSAFGLKLILTTDVYQKTTRILKYASMFIIFTFAAFFISEIIKKRKLHPIQYILIGLAILVFYTLLISLSEYIKFNHAYIVSALSITIMITGYAYGILRNKRFAYTVSGILAIMYLYLFIVLQLEDYALIMGSVGLFVILSSVMYITRKIDWYAIETN
ncbi:cell envelope integrity protein CreD [Desulfoprunum benzoelyticum]|nr:cell envelope integrity protein CreD [Desulfoprunum benzoelyticum]